MLPRCCRSNDTSITVSFTPPVNVSKPEALSYWVSVVGQSSIPALRTSCCRVTLGTATGLHADVSYVFAVNASNALGSGPCAQSPPGT